MIVNIQKKQLSTITKLTFNEPIVADASKTFQDLNSTIKNAIEFTRTSLDTSPYESRIICVSI